MKNLTDFRKTVETGVDPRLLSDTHLNEEVCPSPLICFLKQKLLYKLLSMAK